MSVYFVFFVLHILLYYCECERGGVNLIKLKTIFLQWFDTVGWVIWPVQTRPRYKL